MNVPKLRFKEFTDEWKQTPLKNIIYSNIIEAPKPTTDYIRLGIRSHCKGTFHELVKIENILSADKMYIVPKNNLILNITFAWEQAIAITDDNDEGKYISNRFPTFAFKDNQLPTFYKYIIPQKRLKYDLNVASPGGAGRNRVLNKKLFLSIPVNIPLLKEQEKIAKFLTTVDKKITNLENTITSLENQKEGLLQQIFSQKLRFKDKNGNNYPNWEKKKLEDISNITMGQSPDSDFVNTEKIGTPFLQGNAEFTNKYPIEKYWCTKPQKIANPTDILLSVRAPVGAINIANKKFCIGRGLSAISFNCNKLFGKYNLEFNLFQLIKKSQGSTFSSINKKDISEVILFIPCLEEQTKIADFLSAFDRKLDNQKAQLEHWKQIKKGLLQQMFV
ncbi:restriction endonuclease subunit S [Megamonas funiformis]|uniref:restriction endonuclease subunit S n=1 Tax=Megamonas funiformis TaxID=437897 RepID=UPI002674DD23|nr:restriction endonuclease subunit S [Megamonas funiformis]